MHCLFAEMVSENLEGKIYSFSGANNEATRIDGTVIIFIVWEKFKDR